MRWGGYRKHIHTLTHTHTPRTYRVESPIFHSAAPFLDAHAVNGRRWTKHESILIKLCVDLIFAHMPALAHLKPHNKLKGCINVSALEYKLSIHSTAQHNRLVNWNVFFRPNMHGAEQSDVLFAQCIHIPLNGIVVCLVILGASKTGYSWTILEWIGWKKINFR